MQNLERPVKTPAPATFAAIPAIAPAPPRNSAPTSPRVLDVPEDRVVVHVTLLHSVGTGDNCATRAMSTS